MQENNVDQPTSLSQLLRESYLAEARVHQRHSEMSRSDSSSQRLVYGPLKGKAEDSVGQEDPHFPDLSAFLSQEELDKSVNLACQAIGHDPREERAEVKAHVTPSAIPSTQPAREKQQLLPTHAPFISDSQIHQPSFQPARQIQEPSIQPDRQIHQPSTQPDNQIHQPFIQTGRQSIQDNVMRNNRASSEPHEDFKRPGRNTPYGLENQSKKEFLNKAADFIEELSSLFKANSSKRIRPRSCKPHRSRHQTKAQPDGTVFSLNTDDRERPVPLDIERPTPPLSFQSEDQVDPGFEHADFSMQDCRNTEEQYNPGALEEMDEAKGPALTETLYTAEPICEPPLFIQKLKSREVPEGSKVQLDCIVRGLPIPEVRWFCEGKELENSPDIQVINNGELHSLIIAEAFEEDTGRYSCFASNFYGTDSTSAEIYIEGASSTDSEGEQHFEHVAQLQRTPAQPAPSLRPVASATVSVCEEDSLSLLTPVCTEEQQQEDPSQPSGQVIIESLPAQMIVPPVTEVSTAPPTQMIVPPVPEVSTAPPTQMIVPPVPEVSTAPPTKMESTLLPAQGVLASLPVQLVSTLPPVETASAPVQEVTASSPALVTSPPLPVQTVTALPLTRLISSTLPIQVAPSQPSIPESQHANDSYPQGLDGRTIMAAPVFTKSLQDLLALEGQLVVLECRVKGVPSPRVDWYREGTTIEDSPDFRILQKKPRSMAESEEICTLVIAEVFPEDSGTFTCTASNKYGTVSSIAALRVKGSDTNSNHVKTLSKLTVESTQVAETSLSDLTVPSLKPQPEAPVTNSIKPHSSTIRLDPLNSSTLRLDPLSTSTLRLDPLSSSMLRQEPLSASHPSLDPLSLSSPRLGSRSSSTSHLDPHYLSTIHQDLPSSSVVCQDPQSSCEVPSPFKSLSSPVLVEFQSSSLKTDHDDSRPFQMSSDPSTSGIPKVEGTTNHKHGGAPSVPLPDPPTSCLKPGVLVNHNEPRSSSRVGLRVHFRLPEDEEDEESDASSSQSHEDMSETLANKEPPPVFAKPKLDPVQLQFLHNQVLLEQQQEGEDPSQQEVTAWPARTHHHHQPQPVLSPTPMPPQTSHPTPILTTALLNSTPVMTLNSTPVVNTTPATLLSTTLAPSLNTTPATLMSTLPSPPQLKTVPASVIPPPLPAHLFSTAPVPHMNTPSAPLFSIAPVTQLNTIHASQLNIAPASMPKTLPSPQLNTTSAPYLSTAPTASLSSIPASLNNAPTSFQNTSPSHLLRTTHASLMNLAPSSQSFNYTRPKEFIAAQALSPVMSPSPTESPVPMLQELAAELRSSSANSSTVSQFCPPPRVFPTRVLKSPTSPPAFVSSPTLVPPAFLNSIFALRPQSPPQASSPTSSSSTPSPIQNPVAFLSSVLPSLPTSPPTNSMGLPRSAPVGLPQGILKKLPRSRLMSDDDIRDNKETLIHDIEKKLRFKDDVMHVGQQKPTYEVKTASRPLGPKIPATVFNYDEEYKVSNFEQRLMSEIEFRLERTPVEESDDDVHHDEIPTGKCIAPIFDKKLKNFRAMEGVPVTLTCKVVGIPIPKVYWFKDGKQILRKNVNYKKIREGDGTCALHIEATTNDDDGNYTVMAANPQGRISCSGHLIVQTGPVRNRLTPMIHSQRVRARVQEVEEGDQTQERFFRPHFLQAPGDMVAHEGRVCRLDCKVSGLPNPELMWLVNGRPIYPDFYHRMLVRENGVHSLVIDPLTQNDAGTYTCIASNKAGQSSFCLELKVVEKEMKQAPQFVEKLQNTGIAEGTPVRLECRVVGMPPPVIFWKKDNDTIPHTKDRVSMHQDATGYVCIMIQPTKKEDAGWYTVSAKNEAGIVSCTARLDIYAQWHQHIPMPMKKVPRTGSRYAALTGQGLDIKSAFPTVDNSPILFSSSPVEATLESEEL